MYRSLLFALLLVSLPAAGLAAPAEQAEQSGLAVLVYPSGARVSLEKDLEVVNGAVTFELPRGARAQTLDLTLADRTVISLESAPAPAPDSPAVAALRHRLQEAQRALAGVEGELASIQARLALWANLPAKFTQAADIEKTEALMASRIAPLYEARAALEPRREEGKRTVERLRNALDAVGGAPADVERITARVFPATDGTVAARLVFTLNNCGWKPSYRIDALPEQRAVKVVQLAEVFQGTGMEWKNAQVTLTSANPGTGLDPRPLQPWVVRPAPQLRAANKSLNLDTAMPMPMAAMPAQAEAIVHSEQATYSIWNLGRRNIPAGAPVRLALDEMTWKAEFVRVLRPSLSKVSFLRAQITLPQPVALPSGPAQFLVDGASVGKGLFSFAGVEDKLFFGEDPRVSAEMLLDTRQSGRKGFIDKEQTRTWAWTIKVRNAHSTAVEALVEEPAPQLRDEAIELKLDASPKPELDNHTYVWRLSVPAGKTETIKHAVTITAPAEMRLADGR